MPQLKCIIDRLPYAGVLYQRGDKFFASDEDARLLKGFGKAADASASGEQTEVFAGEQPKRRGGRYRRADMRAED